MIYDLSFSPHEVAPYVNWLYFFHAWGFPARLGSIAKVHGCEACRQNWLQSFINKEERARAREAMKLYDEAQMLLRHFDENYKTYARIALLPAHSEDDDIVVEMDDQSARIPLLRQQTPGKDGLCLCLSDFVHPKEDRVGLFVSTVDRAMEEEDADDDYQHLLHQTLADRLAEATAEKAHELVRTQLWGYAPDERLTIEEMFVEKYQGKRPAVGYPSMPDQSINFILDNILTFSEVGVSLTENGAMRPHASTSGLILAHPATRHFSIGEIGPDQLTDYARRRGKTVEEMKKFL